MREGEIRERVHELLLGLKRPATEKDLLKLLRAKGDARAEAKRVLEEMISEGKLARTRAGRLGLPEKMNLVAGRLETKSGGFGFVRPDLASWKDIYIAGADLGDALHGDRVLVAIERKGRGGKMEGRIVEVLDRAHTQIVGRFEKDHEGSRVIPFDPRMLHEIFIASGEEGGAEVGEMVVAEFLRYPGRFRAPSGRIVKVLGKVDDPGVDVAIMIAKFEIPESFPEDVIREAELIPAEVDKGSLEGRTDFRDQSIVTIDGETAKDFDDAVRVERLSNGSFLLGVHIADVGRYVKEDSRLDEEALERGNSVYFPERAVPMLPEKLSNGICSLNPGVDRLVQSVLIEISPKGRIVNYDFHDGIIRSVARMTYKNVWAILEDHDPDTCQQYEHLVPLFENMRELYAILRQRRHKRGSIDFDLPEPEILLDVEGVMTGVIAAERNVAHRIIEEFMLIANEVVATYLAQLDVPSLYRVHDLPEDDKVEEFEELIANFGYRLRASNEKLKPKSFQKLLERVEGQPEERFVSYLMLRTMKQAIYSSDNTGHYALAAPIYTHFTSPIRRYPDLVVHRLLREVRRRGMPSDEKREEREARLPAIAEQASMTERRAEDAERELVDWKKVRFMKDKVGEVFNGFVTGVMPFGLFVELEEFFVEGLVHISALADDYYNFSEKAHTLRGESTGKVFRLGDRLEAKVVRVDIEARQIDLVVEGAISRTVPVSGPIAKRGKAKEKSQKKDKRKDKGKSSRGKRKRR